MTKFNRKRFEAALYDFFGGLTIASKDEGERPFLPLMSTQKYMLDRILDGLEQDIHSFVVCKARQLGSCLAPETRVLTADLRWVPIGDIEVGEAVVSVEEEPRRRGASRRMLTGIVEGKRTMDAARYRVRFDDGRSVICTGRHPWLSSKTNTQWDWRTISSPPGAKLNKKKRLTIGTKIRSLVVPWGSPDFEDGWFSGMLDGEGSLAKPSRSGVALTVSQRAGAVWDRLCRYCWERGHRPLNTPHRYATIVGIDALSWGPVVDLQTSTGTYVAEGLVSHNTTLCLALSLFWCGEYAGMQGGIIADTESNRDETIRSRLDGMIDGLPADYPLPLRRNRSGHNKNGVHFEQGSVLQYLVAGTRKGTGSLGRSRSMNFLLATEVAGYGDGEQVEIVKAALSDVHPHRLYIWESTPNSLNHFYDLYRDATHDVAQRAIFIAWWRNDRYEYGESDVLYEQYGQAELTQEERETSDAVMAQYGHRITRGQWAWYRHHRNPSGDTEVAAMRAERFCREYPSTEEEAFRASGVEVMKGRALGEIEEIAKTRLFLPYCFDVGEDFRAMKRTAGRRGLRVDLKVWQEPVPGASYVVAGDAAYASSDAADAYCIQVCRCYADRIDQVAEYHHKGIEPYQFTWILAYICGMYENVRMVLEINGPGEAVKTEFRHLRTLAASGKLEAPEGAEPEFLPRVKYYLYHRPDSLGSGYAVDWKTGPNNRTPLLIGLIDQIGIKQCTVNSVALIDEIRRLRRDGNVIEPQGRAHDDRVMALAMAVRVWLDWERAILLATGRTWAAENAKPEKPPATEAARHYLTANVNQYFERQAEFRAREVRRARMAQSRGHWDF